jgi:LysR family transcriptional regulator, regulator for bpeEF and oprC
VFNKLQAITAFARVAELASFSAAAAKLGISPSAVTKLVARLEHELGARLLNRTTRRLSLTDQGRDFYQRCVHILGELDDAEAALLEANRAPRGTVRAAIPISFSRVTVIPALPEFYARYPDVKVEIVSTDRPVDLIEDGFDVAISGRAGADTPAGLVRRLLIRSSFVTVASPKYLAAHGVPSEPTDLMRHNCILNPGSAWLYRLADGSTQAMRVQGNLKVSSGDALREAAVAGIGLAYSTWWLFRKDLEAGAVVPVLADFATDGPPISLFYPANPYLPVRVRSFIEFMAEIVQAPQGGRAPDRHRKRTVAPPPRRRGKRVRRSGRRPGLRSPIPRARS